MYDEDSELQKIYDQRERNRTYEEAKEPDEDHCSRCGRLLNWLQWHSDYEFDERGWWDCENENCPDSIFYME